MAAFRPDIQALRAVAVLLVVAFHVWPAHVHGGYVGVDVFFVISGYLITGHLVREVASSGRVDLRGFYARRARRLLPAASLTLVVVGVASYLFMPSWTWATTAADIAASTGYAENWMLVRRAVDYQAQNETPSPLQHFWSLAVEEQFYLGWPLLVAGVAAAWRKWSGRRLAGSVSKGGDAVAFAALQPSSSSPPAAVEMAVPPTPSPPPPHRAWYAVPMATACIASLATALFYAHARPEAGYFTTHTRLYELGMGGLLAVLGAGGGLARPAHPAVTYLSSDDAGTSMTAYWLRTAVAVAGVAAIGTSAALFTARTTFPGAAALAPTLGATALLWAGETTGDAHAHALTAPMSHAWLQYIGDVSYSLYLAHWPVVVIYPFATGRVVEGVLADGVLVCVISFALAHACKRCWEDRFRTAGSGAPDQSKQVLVAAGGGGTAGLAGPGTPTPPTTRRCCASVTPNLGALIMTLLMVTATLTASLALHKLAPAVYVQGNDNAVLAGVEEAGDTPGVVAAPNRTASTRPTLPPSPECAAFFGPNATRPYPGAEAVIERCTTINSLPIQELVDLAAGTHPHGIVKGNYYPDAINPVRIAAGLPATPPATLRNVVIMGDSHGRRWNPPFLMVARRLGLNITNLSKSGCAPTLTPLRTRPDPTVVGNVCQVYNTDALHHALSMKPEAVVLVAYKKSTPLDPHGNATTVAAGIVELAEKLVAANIPVLYIKSTPVMGKFIYNCLVQEAKRDPAGTDLSACSVSREEGLRDGVIDIAARLYPMMRRLSFDDILCPGDTCPPALGNVVMYGDKHHLVRPAAESLAGALHDKLLEKAPHLGR